MDSSKLLEELLPDASDEVRDTAKQFHTAFYSEHMPQLRLLPGSRELLEAVAARGHAVVLATSAPQNELDRLLELLDADEWVTAVTGGEDVEQAKPAPDIIGVALEKVGVDAGSAVMVGDAMWDVESSGRVGGHVRRGDDRRHRWRRAPGSRGGRRVRRPGRAAGGPGRQPDRLARSPRVTRVPERAPAHRPPCQDGRS
ncbi:HAD hydrolase-like protein [Curtobacterium sp. MCJR17_043]|uniref:HAD family hydrolase n=1 Tax=Curtobacterium sp. MCJR17_043 TaxID=2175660 RepID=UPI0024DFA476|nr:HAD hydrolase-like protein [Curtobacterium sp. MCJR17_043]WIB36274.1 HAD hydrolase-like protein [Curtobacterium sp. MCJR17_043]